MIKFETTDILCCPMNEGRVTVKAIITGGVPPYTINWEDSKLIGEGPFTFSFKGSLNERVTVRDANNSVLSFNYNKERTEMDQIKFDYRNNIIGTYSGIYSSKWVEWPAPNVTVWKDTMYATSVTISKNEAFDKINVSLCGELVYHNTSIKFGDAAYSLTSCIFRNDSLLFGQTSNHSVWTKGFKGKRN